MISGLMELYERVAYLTRPVSVVPFSTLILRAVVTLMRCAGICMLLSFAGCWSRTDGIGMFGLGPKR